MKKDFDFNYKKVLTKKAFMSYFQVIVILISSFAFSYLLYVNINPVSAENQNCCDKTKSGAVCQPVSDSSECEGNFAPTSCDSMANCIKGCCVSSETGMCNENTPKISCTSGFKSMSCDQVNECKKGCCLLNDNAEWITEKECEIQAQKIGIPFIATNFSKSVKSDIMCRYAIEKSQLGACVMQTENKNNCKYTTLEQCNSLLKIKNAANPNFFIGKFCSDPVLNTSCKAKDHKSCVDQKSDIYWFDSCGNQEDIAKTCDIIKEGRYCSKTLNGDYNCKDINCHINGKTRKNGESWCSYDDFIGNGKDLVGSRQIRHVCYMGEERIEPCADYRNEICVQSDVGTGNGLISQAACRVNNWRECFAYNTKNESAMTSKCEKNPDCLIRDTDIDKNFKFKLCVPEYPPGFELKFNESKLADEDYKSPSEGLCSIASQQCTEVWVCSLLGGCKCKVNCDCHQKEFTEKMNELCINLGDCGAYANWNGDVTDGGYQISSDGNKPPRLSVSEILALENKAGPKPAKPGDLKFLGSIGNYQEANNGNATSLGELLQGVSGAMGSALLIRILSGNGIIESATGASVSNMDFAKFTNGFATIQAGTTVNYQLKKILGVPTGAFIGGIIGAVIGGIIGYMISGAIGAMIGALILGALLFFLFFVKIKYVHINFKCLPWQSPPEGNCDKCNQNLNIPCTKYRCESLGQNCELINEGTDAEMCFERKQNYSVPQIKPWNGKVDNVQLFALPTNGYSYSEITDNGFKIINSTSKGCIEAFTSVKIGIGTYNTDGSRQPTLCKLDVDASKTFQDMADDFDQSHPGIKLPFHSRTLFFPTPEALKNKYNLTEEQVKKLGDLKLYVKCQNSIGTESAAYQINFCVNAGPDFTPPQVSRAVPESGTILPFGQNSLNLTIYTNEPSNCRWNKEDKTKRYEDMNNSFYCENDLENPGLYGYSCNSNINGIQNITEIYIKCRDLSENNNTMSEAYAYNIHVSSSQLAITSVSPLTGQKIISGIQPVEVVLGLQTEGGAENGKAICEWNGNGFSDQFTTTDSNVHSYEWKYAMGGNYNLNFECKDIAGNIATSSTSFEIFIDNNPPQLIRAYNQGGLKITTNKEAECKYSFDKNFIFENASSMGSLSVEHIGEWKAGTFYLQCKDSFENKGGITKIKTYNIQE